MHMFTSIISQIARITDMNLKTIEVYKSVIKYDLEDTVFEQGEDEDLDIPD